MAEIAETIPLSPEEIRKTEWRQTFNLIDKKSTGMLIPTEAIIFLRSLGEDVSDEEMNDMIQDCMVYAKGGFTFSELCEIMEKREQETAARERLEAAFKLFDRDGNGYIYLPDIKAEMQRIGDLYTDQEFEEFTSEIVVSPDGMVNYRDFVKILIQK